MWVVIMIKSQINIDHCESQIDIDLCDNDPVTDLSLSDVSSERRDCIRAQKHASLLGGTQSHHGEPVLIRVLPRHEPLDYGSRILNESLRSRGAMVDGEALAAVQFVDVPGHVDEGDEMRRQLLVAVRRLCLALPRRLFMEGAQFVELLQVVAPLFGALGGPRGEELLQGALLQGDVV